MSPEESEYYTELELSAIREAETGCAFMDAGAYDAALTSFEKAASMCPEEPIFWYDIAVTLRELGEYEKGLEAVDKAIRLDASDPQFRHARGNLMRSLGNLEEAVSEFKSALELDPNFPAQNNLGLTYYELGQLELARDILEVGLNLTPDDADLLQNLGKVLYELDRFAVGTLCDERAVRLRPGLLSVWKRLSKSYVRLGGYGQAAFAMRQVIDLGEATAENYSILGDLMLSAGRVKEATRAYENGRKREV